MADCTRGAGGTAAARRAVDGREVQLALLASQDMRHLPAANGGRRFRRARTHSAVDWGDAGGIERLSRLSCPFGPPKNRVGNVSHRAAHPCDASTVSSMAPTVYIETSVISYLTSRPSRDVITAAHQQLTLDWWSTARGGFRVFISEIVVQEASLGDPSLSHLRIAALEGLPLLQLSENARELAGALVRDLAIPAHAAVDALHVAVAADNGVNFLLTWNCKHIANAKTRLLIERSLRSHGYTPPVLCTPEELLEA